MVRMRLPVAGDRFLEGNLHGMRLSLRASGGHKNMVLTYEAIGHKRLPQMRRSDESGIGASARPATSLSARNIALPYPSGPLSGSLICNFRYFGSLICHLAPGDRDEGLRGPAAVPLMRPIVSSQGRDPPLQDTFRSVRLQADLWAG